MFGIKMVKLNRLEGKPFLGGTLYPTPSRSPVQDLAPKAPVENLPCAQTIYLMEENHV